MAGGLRIARETYDITSVDEDEVMRSLGYRGQELSPELADRMRAVMARCVEVARPRGGMASFHVARRTGDSLELRGCALRLSGRDIARHLADADEVALFAVTLGADVDRELRRLSLVDPLEQVVFDAAASALVERAADAANARIRAYAAAAGAYTSWRFSPGYGDLPLLTQGPLLAALDANRQLGITLTQTNLMVPTKSVTAVVGIHPTPQPGLESSCSVCSLAEFCTLRLNGRTCREA